MRNSPWIWAQFRNLCVWWTLLEDQGFYKAAAKIFLEEPPLTVWLEIVGFFLGQGINSEAAVSSCLCFLSFFFFPGKMSSGGWFQWAALAGVGILWGQSMPIQNSNKPLPDFFCQTEDRMACWEGSRRAVLKQKPRLSIPGCWAPRFFPAWKFCVKERGGQVPTGEEAFTAWH